MDPDTFEFIYSVWLYGSGSTIQAPASTAPVSSAPAQSVAAPDTATTATTSTTLAAGPGPVDTTTTSPVVPATTGNSSVDPAFVSNGPNDSGDIPPFTTVTDSVTSVSTIPCTSAAFTQMLAVTTTVPCSDGTMETAVAVVPTVIYYDPAYSTVRTVIDQTTTRYVLVPVTAFVTETASRAPTNFNAPINAVNSTAASNATTATSTGDVSAQTFVVTAGADKSSFGGLSALGLVIAALAGFALS